MRNLLKTDLKRIFSDKLFMVVCILGGAFAIVMPVLYKLIFKALGLEGELEMLLPVNAKSIFFTAFSFSDNFGLIMTVLIAVILCKDFSFGTIRNKIICGKSRTQIFLSIFISSAIVIAGLMLAHALLSLGVSLIFFDYQSTPFTLNDLWYAVSSVLMHMLIAIFMAAMVSFICVLIKNVGGTIVVCVAVIMLFSLIGGIVEVAFYASEEMDEVVKIILEVVYKANLFSSPIVGKVDSYTTSDICYAVISPAAFTALFVTLGIITLNKKDLK